MRIALLTLALLVFASYACADETVFPGVSEAYVPPAVADDVYDQPPHDFLQTGNASAGFGSWLIDDVPDHLYGYYITAVVFRVSQWGGYWIDPDGVTMAVIDAECPPGTPVGTHFFEWDLLDKVQIWDDPGWFESFECTAYLSTCIFIGYDMSLGFQVENTWGTVAPYCGVVMTNDYDVYGDCEAWWVGTYWGYEGYMSGYFGTPWDVAYGLHIQTEPSATDATSWGSIKSLYR